MSLRIPASWERLRIRQGLYGTKKGAPYGMFRLPTKQKRGGSLLVMVSDGNLDAGVPWEHVSVSLPARTPTWEEMALVKSALWDREDCVLQYHPPASMYVNAHPYCLHLWRAIGIEVPVPPRELLA